jgi:hypothetical protein
MIVDVVIPTLRKTHAFGALESLKHLPFAIKLHLISEGSTWPEAANIGLRASRNDVLLMDDDVVLSPTTFCDFASYYDLADIFGFKLLYPSGLIQHGGGFVSRGAIGHLCAGLCNSADSPLYVCHVTASLTYIKRHVIEHVGYISESYSGYQLEDVDYSFRALKAGMRILYVPRSAEHRESATKAEFADFRSRIGLNYEQLVRTHLSDPDFVRLVESFPIPLAFTGQRLEQRPWNATNTTASSH